MLILTILLSITSISASELVQDNLTESDLIESEICNQIDDVDPEVSNIQVNLDNDIISSDNEQIIHVNNNNTHDGDGTSENPFTTLDSACNSVDEYKDKIIVNVYEGNYTIGSLLTFNTSNLHINGMNGKVILKNLYDDNVAKQSFALTGSGNFTMSNIIIDASGYTQWNYEDYWFAPIIGNDNTIIFNNCTFTGYNGEVIILADDYLIINNKCIFNECKFVNFTNERFLSYGEFSNFEFNYCVFSATFKNGIGMEENAEAIFNKCWFGANDLKDTLMFYGVNKYGKYSRAGINEGRFKFTKNAIFDISENYLGDNKFEIIGKLMWNDSTTEDIDKLGLMTVNLNSTTGDLNQTTAILENGIFKVLYTSTSSNNNISAVLDNQKIDLIFTNMDMSLSAPNVRYGEKLNITVTLPQAVYGTVTVLVDGISYPGNIENNNSIIIPITDTLSVGSHNVNVTFIDEENHIYAFNTTTITVNKVSNYDFDATITPNTVYIGENATVNIINLPAGATGNVTIKVGDNEAKTFNINDIISINGFVVGNNTVNITFISDNYETKSIVKYVTASSKPTTITAINVTTTYKVGKELVITLTSGNEVLANKTINVILGSMNENLTTNANGQISMDISTLAPNSYVANITFIGDEIYAKSNTTANVIVNKVASSLTAPAVTATYNVGKNLVITLTANGNALANQKVTVKVGTITKTLTTDAKGQVSVDVSKLTPKTYTATFTYAGDDINTKSSNTAKVVVNKAKPKITAKKATFKAKKKTKKYSIVLKDNKGKAIKKAKVTLKVKGKTYKATTNAKGKATFKITKLTKKGKQTATIKFGGNTFYKAVSKKVKLTIKK